MKTENRQIHQCENNPYLDVGIEYQQINVDEDSWVIDYTWRASQTEVDDGVAEKVDDIIMMDTILISYCPFCGKKLTDEKQDT